MDHRPDVLVLVLFVRRLCDSWDLSAEVCGDGTVESSDTFEDRLLEPESEIKNRHFWNCSDRHSQVSWLIRVFPVIHKVNNVDIFVLCK